jgi:hypothetical protein
MDVATGHLVTEETYSEMSDEDRYNYCQVPDDLSLSAKLELMGKDETIVGQEATSQIAIWARSKRNRLKIKVNKRKLCCQ